MSGRHLTFSLKPYPLNLTLRSGLYYVDTRGGNHISAVARRRLLPRESEAS